MTSVIVTGGVAIWSKVVDARSARALAFESRVWQAKNDVLRRLISASRAVKRWTEIYRSQPDPDDEIYNRVRLAQALGRLKSDVGGEDGITELATYAGAQVRDSVDEMLALVEKQLGAHRVALFMLNNAETQLDLVRLATRDEDGNPTARLQEEEKLRGNRAAAMTMLEKVSIDVDAVATLCDRIIDVARQEIQGR